MATNTIMTGIKEANFSNLTDYAIFLQGINVTRDALQQFDPIRGGYGRLFCVNNPLFVVDAVGVNKWKVFKHILEYGNTAVSGLSDITQNFNQITGGYTGKSFEIPSFAQDDTNSFSVQCYEFTSSPLREVLHTWINGTNDLSTGLTHYNGVGTLNSRDEKAGRRGYRQGNQTAEFIYVATDNTGEEVEYACLFANCFPKGINTSAFNYSAGEHNLIEMTIEFTCVKYESIQINRVAKALINKYKILSNSLNLYSGINDKVLKDYDEATGHGSYNPLSGKLDDKTGKSTQKPMEPSEFKDGLG